MPLLDVQEETRSPWPRRLLPLAGKALVAKSPLALADNHLCRLRYGQIGQIQDQIVQVRIRHVAMEMLTNKLPTRAVRLI
jgi:hypothetical protein